MSFVGDSGLSESSVDQFRSKEITSTQFNMLSCFQMNNQLIRSDIIPIFAVGDYVYNDYRKISDHLTQLSSVGR